MKVYLTAHLTALLSGYLLDLLIGDPQGWPHPVRLIGSFIAFLEKKLNRGPSAGKGGQVFRGLIMSILVTGTAVLLTGAVLFGAYRLNLFLGIAAEAVLTCYVLAAKCLYKESMEVYNALAAEDMAAAAYKLSMIVGRDTAVLDREGIIRAAVETVAENTSDGVIAPLIYTAIGGPVAGMLYKAVNTMDSMVGYHNERYEYFGKAAARLDDLFNLIPSRLSALLMIASAALASLVNRGFSGSGALKIWLRDRYKHKSPNSAQTESACAGALGIRLGGDSYYGGVLVHKSVMGDARREIKTEDIRNANTLMFLSGLLAVLIFAAAGTAVIIGGIG
ncbi:MAG: cobalamin biosynthesis protein CobD [Lachnospiraceae bacterium]|nr:cobalamin biosynthesis protein CobD [Lachnospiraceae bacterium]